MKMIGTPDLVSNGRVARTLAQVQRDMMRKSEEVTTGLKSDVAAATAGDPARLYAIERDISLNENRVSSLGISMGRAGGIQNALARLEEASGAVGLELAAAVTRGDRAAAEIEASKARDGFEESVSALNSRFGDRSLFSGAATDRSALAPADDILAEIATRVASATSAADVITAVEDYFSDPAGFAATGYLGSTTDASAAELSPGQFVDFEVRADRDEVVQTLTALALGVIGVEGGFAGETPAIRMELMGEAAQRGLNAGAAVVKMRSEVGVAEQRLDVAKTRTEAELSFLQIERNGVIAADPFQASVAFIALETQLQTIFSVTARLSTLNLTNYLR